MFSLTRKEQTLLIPLLSEIVRNSIHLPPPPASNLLPKKILEDERIMQLMASKPVNKIVLAGTSVMSYLSGEKRMRRPLDHDELFVGGKRSKEKDFLSNVWTNQKCPMARWRGELR